MNLWLLMLLGGVITFTIRFSFIFLIGRVAMPNWFMRAMRFVPAAVLSAITLPAIVRTPPGNIDLTFHNPQWISGMLAVLVAWRTRSILWTVGSGLAVYLLLLGLQQFLLTR
ncbi:MAG: AzlD domain-containing protein [Chloroflexota bacterium]